MVRAKTVYVIKFLRFFPFEYPRRRHVENEIQITDASSVRLMMIILAGPSRSAVKDKKGKGGNIFFYFTYFDHEETKQEFNGIVCLDHGNLPCQLQFSIFLLSRDMQLFLFPGVQSNFETPAQFLAQTYSLYFDRAFSFC